MTSISVTTGALGMNQISGNSFAGIRIAASPVSDMMRCMMGKDLRVSATVMPLMRLMIQKTVVIRPRKWFRSTTNGEREMNRMKRQFCSVYEGAEDSDGRNHRDGGRTLRSADEYGHKPRQRKNADIICGTPKSDIFLLQA
jgi:hypothetical protein